MDDDISFLGEPIGQVSDDDLLGEPLGSLDGSIPDYDPLLGEPNAIPSEWDDLAFMLKSGAMDSVYGIKQKVTGDDDQGDQDRVKRLMEDPKMMDKLVSAIGNFRSVPQIIVDGEHVGGLEGFQTKLKKGDIYV